MNKLRIVHVDDNRNVLSLMKKVVENGFRSQDREVILEQHPDFSSVHQDIDLKKLADVYILDNEITGHSIEGAEIAQKIYNKAKELGKEVTVITLLSSNPEGVIEKYGEGLGARNIPVLHKQTETPLCFFYIGDCLKRLEKKEESLALSEWLKKEGVKRKEGELDWKTIDSLMQIQSRLCAYISIRAEGAFWKPLSSFINMNRENIESKMLPQAIEVMNSIFPRRKRNSIETES